LLLTLTVVLSACADETEELLAQISQLEAENATLSASVSSYSTDLEQTQRELSIIRGQLEALLAEAEAEEEEADQEGGTEQGQQAAAVTFAITFGGSPNFDMTFILADGPVWRNIGLRVDFDEFDEDVEISWESTNTNIFTVEEIEGYDGLRVAITAHATGNARLIATVGDRETYSWVRVR